MPSLTPEDQAQLLGPQWKCEHCGQFVYKNYCRSCDEFFYQCGCPPDNHHASHRTY